MQRPTLRSHLLFDKFCQDSQVYGSCPHVKTQELPNCYRPWTALANNHNLLRRPHYATTNARGDRFFSEVENHYIGMCTCHNPPKFKVVCGVWNYPGKPKQGMGTESQMRFGGQLTVLAIKPGKDEYLHFADVGNGIIRRVSGAHSYDAPHCVNTVLVSNSQGKPIIALATYSTIPSRHVMDLLLTNALT